MGAPICAATRPGCSKVGARPDQRARRARERGRRGAKDLARAGRDQDLLAAARRAAPRDRPRASAGRLRRRSDWLRRVRRESPPSPRVRGRTGSRWRRCESARRRHRDRRLDRRRGRCRLNCMGATGRGPSRPAHGRRRVETRGSEQGTSRTRTCGARVASGNGVSAEPSKRGASRTLETSRSPTPGFPAAGRGRHVLTRAIDTLPKIEQSWKCIAARATGLSVSHRPDARRSEQPAARKRQSRRPPQRPDEHRRPKVMRGGTRLQPEAVFASAAGSAR